VNILNAGRKGTINDLAPEASILARALLGGYVKIKAEQLLSSGPCRDDNVQGLEPSVDDPPTQFQSIPLRL
jgi:hypothetical protein